MTDTNKITNAEALGEIVIAPQVVETIVAVAAANAPCVDSRFAAAPCAWRQALLGAGFLQKHAVAHSGKRHAKHASW